MTRSPHFVPSFLALFALLGGACGGNTDGPPTDAGGDTTVADGATSDAASDAAQDAAPAPCPTEGEMRVVDCGRCGSRSDRCEAGAWAPLSECLGQGACSVGSVETEATPLCGERQRLCTTTCEWSPWTALVPDAGECEAGTERRREDVCPYVGEYLTETCSATCAWEPYDLASCTDDCGNFGRRTNGYDDEICVPAGDVMVGYMGEFFPVELTDYYISRYPVTVGRYMECVAAGGCTLPESTFFDPTQTMYPIIDAIHSQASQFCTWDGDRRLQSLMEWTKAARGPAPRTVLYPWGDGFSCDNLPVTDCPSYVGEVCSWPTLDPVDTDIRVVSYYGMEMAIGLGHAWVRDFAHRAYFLSSTPVDFLAEYDRRVTPGLVDPDGPADGLDYAWTIGSDRGCQSTTVLKTIDTRGTSSPTSPGYSFRCVRRP
ncbi:MAG: SUMF1/EgtB/PvdO family nonheme iron enzyme [Myxococcales bacterium]|nr:SUMF1/EgtB/PvdO family nonheme iron enzyme [Myxococcales bacterium]